MVSMDFLDLKRHEIVGTVKKSLPKNISKALNVLTVKDNVLFTWDFQSHCILTLNIKAARDNSKNDGVICQKLLPVTPPMFMPEKIVANDSGTLLVVAGPNGVLVFDLPPRCPPFGSFNNNKELVYCRTHCLDERLLTCNDNVEVLQVKFHPGSVKDNHILLLTSDNTLRLYQIEDEVIPLGVYPVGDKPMARVPCSKMTFLGALGEVAVDFDFGNPEINGEKKEDLRFLEKENFNNTHVKIQDPFNDTESFIAVNKKLMEKKKSDKVKERENYSNFNWPVYILSADFIINIINIPLYEKTNCTLKGPIPIMPTSVLQCDKRACSLICINSTPQVVCIASTNGEILQGLVLGIEQDENESSMKKSRADREIYIFEAVDIELGLTTTLPQQEEGYTCPIFLHKDESRWDRYFATHSAGVHTVSIGCMEDLQKLSTSENTSDVFSIPSVPEYLVCTKTSTSKNNNPVVGFSMYYNPYSFITLLANGNILSLALVSIPLLPKIEKLSLETETAVASPMQEMLKMPFNQYIHNLLKKADSHPIMKLAKNENPSLQECHELIQKTSQIIHEKIKYHTKAREEIEKRATSLQLCKDYQLQELENLLTVERQNLQKKAESLAEKYEDIREKQEVLMKRCSNLLMLLSMKKNCLSDAETEYLERMKEMRIKLNKCDTAIDKLIVKQNYQETQMRNWKNQQQKKSYAISDTHKNTIKDNLVASSTRINEMVEQIQAMKKQLHLK